MGLTDPSVVRARVIHARRFPEVNRFSYAVDYLLLDEEALAGKADVKLFSYGRPNLVSLHPKDHGVAGCKGIEGVWALARERRIKGVDRVLLLTQPRYWGYVFNPVSFWLMAGSAGNLRAVLAEVHNTWGDRHGYLCALDNGADIDGDSWTVSRKRLHVSPFFDIAGEYRFRFRLEESSVSVRIRYDDGQGGGIETAISGERRAFTDREIARALLSRPFGAAKTTALIHWQALRLWRKGVLIRRRPTPPKGGIT
ncbi:MAG: DUF1365 domain-containing protein [Roseovarius sp.]|nr:DUF1365 domain-containing protein [Roseovarius sp.]MCY4208942.1 DUF1365 domain-containing protein [Roseovarius sp.]MCY4292972.1 DUF1365 domain-containing protein [Roseovarius sp.]MCY4316677.1 DUF1365 domain-containing protein [Roseovarius sp.]